jgi:hypothetical protein
MPDEMDAIKLLAKDVWNTAMSQAAAIVKEAASLERAAEDIEAMRD